MIGGNIKEVETGELQGNALNEHVIMDAKTEESMLESAQTEDWSPFSERSYRRGNRNILYHFIDGFVIEEADTPFESEVDSLLTKKQLHDIWKRQQELIAEENKLHMDRKKQNQCFNDSPVLKGVKQKCEYCGTVGDNHYSLRFCTLLCCRRHSVSRARIFKLKAQRLRDAARKQVAKRKYFETPPVSPVAPEVPLVMDESGRKVALSPSRWTVDNVCKYIESLPDSKSFAADFRKQEIDGSALILLKEDHLISTLNIKLGPALKLCSHIRKLHEE